MRGFAKLLRWTAFVFMALFGLLGTLFVAGYAFADLPVLTAVLLTSAWVVPMVGLGRWAVRRPDLAAPVLVWVTAGVIVFTVVDHAFGVIPRDDWGPVAAVVVFAVGVALAFLGLHRASLAGVLMVVLAGSQLAGVLVALAVRETGEGPGPGGLLGTSSGVVVLPILLSGFAFWLSGRLADEPVGPLHREPHPVG